MITYARDVPRGSPAAIEIEKLHVIAHLSAVASADDDPETNADDVVIEVVDHPDDPSLVRIIGTLDGQANAPYLRDDYDPFAGVDQDLLAKVII